MNILITGSSGFVGPYLVEELLKNYPNCELFSFNMRAFGFEHEEFVGDICDVKIVDELVEKVRPDLVFHLAGFSSQAKSFDYPELVLDVNVGGTRNILEAVKKYSPDAKILIVSSAAVYGKPSKVYVDEGMDLQETSPYSKSRIEQEKLISLYPDLYIVVSRSFNHTGPGQIDEFVLSSFAKQVADIKLKKIDPVILVGNLEVVRDFSDVRDVVRAYRLLLEEGRAGEIYNVGSGQGYELKSLLDKLIDIAGVKVEVKVDEKMYRPLDVPKLIADISKIKQDTSWSPVYSIDKTLEDLLNYWQNKN